MISPLKQYLLLPLACLSALTSSAALPAINELSVRTEPYTNASAKPSGGHHGHHGHHGNSGEYSKGYTGGYQNAAYYVNWAIYGRNYHPQQLPASELSHILYAFANLYQNGTVYLSDPNADIEKHYSTDSWSETGNNAYGCLKQLYLLKKHNRQLKTLLSIGGWTYSTNFAGAASTNATRAQFASTSVKLLADLGFDGLDIDWEYPANAVEAANFVLLLKAIREELDAYAAKYAPGYHFLLTVATAAGPTNYNVLDMAGMDPYLDTWHLMSFDYAGSWDNVTGNMANLYPSSSVPASTQYSTNQAVTDYISKGVNPSKLVMGLPLYGRSFENTTGLGLPFSGIGSGSWENGVWDYKVLPRDGATEYYLADAVATYSFDNSTKELISYDSVKSVKVKANYIKDHGMRGAFYWESSADRNGSESLISTTRKAFKTLDDSENLLDYPASVYANFVAGMPGE